VGPYRWNEEKNEQLKAERGIGFEQIVMHVERGDALGDVVHPNREKFPHQRMLVVNVDGYVHLVPYVEDEEGAFLKTIIPSRKATRDYLGGKHEDDQKTQAG
jgi:uncharacterized DUF497 family protein